MNMPDRTEFLKVLMIDDDVELSGMTRELLLREGMDTQCVATATQGLGALASWRPDLLLLDLMLPDANGMDVCRRLRDAGNALPILMLTARGDPIDRVLGLEIGADDYLGKPFEPRELVARIRALIRRDRAAGKRTQMHFVGMTIDLMARRVISIESGPAGDVHQVLQLTSNEFKLLAALASQPGFAISRDELSASIQPGGYIPQDRAVDVQIARLRKKLHTAANGRDWIETIRGEGYVFTGTAI